MTVLAHFKSLIFGKPRAIWLYRRGMLRAKLHRNDLAIADYTAVIERVNARGSLRAMALYNRALVYCAISQESNAIADLNLVLEMSDATRDVRTAARRKLVRMKRNSNLSVSPEPIVESCSKGGIHACIEPKTAGSHSG